MSKIVVGSKVRLTSVAVKQYQDVIPNWVDKEMEVVKLLAGCCQVKIVGSTMLFLYSDLELVEEAPPARLVFERVKTKKELVDRENYLLISKGDWVETAEWDKVSDEFDDGGMKFEDVVVYRKVEEEPANSLGLL